MTIETTRFGQLEVDPDAVITVPRGLIGFPPDQRFALVEHSPNAAFQWLQSLDDPALAFVVVEPHVFFPDYEIELSDGDVRTLGIATAQEARILTTVTIRRTPKEVTTNLLGPLVIGVPSRQAVQIIVDGDRYTTRVPLPLAGSETSTAAPANA